MPRRDNTGSRRAAPRRDRQRVLIVCGGVRTEPDYLRGLRDSLANRSVDVVLLGIGRSPLEMVRYAQKKRASDDFDEVWCVVDVDEFDVETAAREATRAKIHLAVSNPAFEFWLLLHHEDSKRHFPNCDAVIARLKRFVPAYQKTQLNFGDFADGVPAAVQRARTLDETVNPSTGMWRLVEKIME